MPVVRLLLPYSQDALGITTAGKIHLYYQKKVENLNTIVKNSGKANVGRFELAYDGPVPGTPQGAHDRVWLPQDPELKKLRYGFSADVVIYLPLVATDATYEAWAPQRFEEFTPDKAFGIAQLPLVDGVLVPDGLLFEHEVLHTLGLQHDAENVAWNPSDEFPTAREHVFADMGVQGVMGAKTIITSSGHRQLLPRLPLFSNPAIVWNGLPAGSPSENNAAMFEIGIKLVSRYHEHLSPP